MIGCIDVEIQAANPSMPLFPMRAFQGSPSSIRVRNVPKRIGKWAIEKIYFSATYPDNANHSIECVLVGGVWVGTIEGCNVIGHVKNGYSIFADGTDENGNAVIDYCLGKGDIQILDARGITEPLQNVKFVQILSAQPATPNEGDMWQVSGAWYIQQDGQAWAIGDDTGLVNQLSAAIQTKADISALTAYALSTDVANELSTKQNTLTDAQLATVNSGITAAKVAQYNSTAAHVYDWQYYFMTVTPYIQEPVWVFSNLTPPTGYEITTDPAYIGGDEWHAMAYPISAGLGDVFDIFANAPEDATVLNFSVNEPDFGHVFSFTATLKQYQKAEVFNFQNNQISVTNGGCDLMVEILQKTSEKMNDLWMNVDCTSLSNDISLALGDGYHPKTAISVDYVCEGGKSNIFHLTEWKQGNFIVERWSQV